MVRRRRDQDWPTWQITVDVQRRQHSGTLSWQWPAVKAADWKAAVRAGADLAVAHMKRTKVAGRTRLTGVVVMAKMISEAGA